MESFSPEFIKAEELMKAQSYNEALKLFNSVIK